MKKNFSIKVLLSFLVILFTLVGCGGKNNKIKVQFFKVKLNSVNDSTSSVPIDKYTFHGHYEGCTGKNEKSAWILTKNEKISNLEVKVKDKNCKLHVKSFFINSVKYTLEESANSSSYINTESIVFKNEQNISDLKFVTIKIFPDDLSSTPYANIDINSRNIQKKSQETSISIGGIFRINPINLSLSSLSVTLVKTPEYNIDLTTLGVGFTRDGMAWYTTGNLFLNLKNGGQKAQKYFFIINNSIDTHDYREVESFFNNSANAAKIKTLNSSEQSRITFSRDFLNTLTSTVRTEIGNTLYIRIVLVNSTDGSNSFSVYGYDITRP